MKTRSYSPLDLLVWLFFLAAVLSNIMCAAPISGTASQEKPIAPHIFQSTNALISALESNPDWPNLVYRDPAGIIVGILLAREFATDQNLRLVSQLNSVETLEITTYRKGWITAQGMNVITNMSKLRSLQLSCFGWIEMGSVLEAVSRCTHLERLSMAEISPPRAAYSYLTALTNLVELRIVVGQNFGPDELRPLARLPRLRSLVLNQTQVSTNATEVLGLFTSVTNLSVRMSNNPLLAK